MGVNPYTGYSYIHYRELALMPVRRAVKLPEPEQKGGNMKRVNIYIHNGIKGVKRQDGVIGIVMEARKKNREMGTMEWFYRLENMTRTQAELIALQEAVKHLTEPCELRVFTTCDAVSSAFEQGWVQRWESTGWLNSKGKPVANKDEWQSFLEILGENEIEFKVTEKHEFSNWMQDEIRKNPSRIEALCEKTDKEEE
jgi:ribonuclease HI